ncbi:hypothetical protein I4U23_006333 [Adineta vaga]|nr:hypothetical protein I4U23_006333 [Adineta vaga]
MSLILIGSLFFVFFHHGITSCPSGYNSITSGCYKVINGSGWTWTEARDYCKNDSSVLPANETEPNSVTHLLALEFATEKNSLFYWMKAYGLQSPFWIDGIVSKSTWNWSDQSISWFFEADKRAVIGNGTNYKLIYNTNGSTFQIADDVKTNKLFFICEYQTTCNSSHNCQSHGQCYMNLGQELCVCNPGYTGEKCEIEVDECLAAPCLHGGICQDQENNYTCDLNQDPRQNERAAAFWAVLGVIISLVMILTFSDLPWTDIMTSIGCNSQRFNCCAKKNLDDDMNDNTFRISNTPSNDNDYARKSMSVNDGSMPSKGPGYQVRNTVWTPEYENNQMPSHAQYNGYRSPDNGNMQSFAANKPKGDVMDDKRIYAVDIHQSTKAVSKTNDPADTMVSWTQQLQEQLRNKKGRESSASSTKQLIHSSNN